MGGLCGRPRGDCRAARRSGSTCGAWSSPRNQWRPGLPRGLPRPRDQRYRGDTSSWLYRAMNEEEESTVRRALRYADAFANLSGTDDAACRRRCEDPGRCQGLPVPLPPVTGGRARSTACGSGGIATRCGPQRARLLLPRLVDPHDFGVNQEATSGILRRILEDYRALHDDDGFASLSMSEVADRVLRQPAGERVDLPGRYAVSIRDAPSRPS